MRKPFLKNQVDSKEAILSILCRNQYQNILSEAYNFYSFCFTAKSKYWFSDIGGIKHR